MDDMDAFAKWMRQRRKSLDLSRAELALRAHCSASAVRRIEAGELRPSRSLAELLAAALGVPAEEREGVVGLARGEGRRLETGRLETGQVAGGKWQVASGVANLPAPMTSFVGRRREVTAVCELLRQDGVRLLTLSGPPGVGKTRLSIAVANRLAETAAFPDGAFFVSLAPVGEPALVVAAVAQMLAVRESQGQGTLHEAVKAFLRPKRLLLVLDNFEQVTAAVPLLTDWLTAAPGVKALVTSREILHAYGEHEFPVPPLDIPDVNRLPSPQARSFYTHYAAIQLFKERARATQHDFRLTADNVVDIARICAWLDGLPLAIEMAAAQVKWQPVDRLYEQLQHRLAALTGGPRDLSPRQQSLRGAIEWSYHLLHAEQQRLFEVCAVFVGGFDEEAVLRVGSGEWRVGSEEWGVESGEWGVGSEEWGVESGEWRVKSGEWGEGLRGLIEKSLLHYEILAGGEIRYGMLESLREYAQERLDGGGQREAARQAHAAYYAGLAQTAEQHFVAGGDQAAWLKRLEQEHNNLRAVMVWATETTATEAVATEAVATEAVATEAVGRVRFALEFARAMYHFWYIRGYLSEGRQWLEAALALDGTPSELRGHVLNNLGALAFLQGDYERAEAVHEQALAIQEPLGDEAGLCRSLESLAILAVGRGNLVGSKQRFEQVLALRRQLGDEPKMLSTLSNLAQVLVLLEAFGAAEQYYHECAELSRAARHTKSLSAALHGLGNVRLALKEYDAALTVLGEALVIRHEMGERTHLVKTLDDIGTAYQHLGEWVRAVTLFSAGQKLHEELGLVRVEVERRQQEAAVALMRAQVGEEAFARAWEEGQAMSEEAAVIFSLTRP